MKIVSKFKDYYDGVQSLGYDPSLIYVRKLKIYEGSYFNSYLYFYDKHRLDRGSVIEYSYGIIGFCGNLYQYVKLINNKNLKHYYCYSLDDVKKAIKKIKNKNLKETFYKKEKFRYYREDLLYKENLNKFFSQEFLKTPEIVATPMFYIKKHSQMNNINLKEIFFEKKSPIFSLYYSQERQSQIIETNPYLKEYEFQKIKDPYTAYQEIAQYISGVLGVNSPETIDISDSDMLYKKGFDNKSFKKEFHPRKNKGE